MNLFSFGIFLRQRNSKSNHDPSPASSPLCNTCQPTRIQSMFAGSAACSPSAAAKQRPPRLFKQFPRRAAVPRPAAVGQHRHWSLCLPGGSQVNQTHTHSLHMCSAVVCFLNFVSCRCVFALSLRLCPPPSIFSDNTIKIKAFCICREESWFETNWEKGSLALFLTPITLPNI